MQDPILMQCLKNIGFNGHWDQKLRAKQVNYFLDSKIPVGLFCSCRNLLFSSQEHILVTPPELLLLCGGGDAGLASCWWKEFWKRVGMLEVASSGILNNSYIQICSKREDA